jgi:hypothetical protein
MIYETLLTISLWLTGLLLVLSVLVEGFFLVFIFIRRHHYFLRKLVLWLDEQERERDEFLKRCALLEYNKARDEEDHLRREILEKEHVSNEDLKQKGRSLKQKTEIRQRKERRLLNMVDR